MHVTYNHGIKKNGSDVIGKGAVIQRIRRLQDDPMALKIHSAQSARYASGESETDEEKRKRKMDYD